MWFCVMAIFMVYAVIFILFEDYDRKNNMPLGEPSDWHLLLFSLVVMLLLGWMLYRYTRRMDQRISHEQIVKQNETRRQMTQNIAHELRTPVASILGYTDTILDNPDIAEETKKQFIIRTNSQARRLTALLNDISTLNRMDYASDMFSKERINISELVADIVEETALAVASKEMSIENCLPEDICISGNWSLIYSIFRNLIDNAINYAGRGATIRLSSEEHADNWSFTVCDNGVGVAPEHLPHIFERFYRVDKGRSRQRLRAGNQSAEIIGGTGLGLAIVKNAVILHAGHITASNAAGGGLQFDFTLKK
jgi:signal transduction histidine kinase